MKFQWDHTAELLAINANLHAQGRFSRDDFHPMRANKPKNLCDPAALYRQIEARKNGGSV